MSHGTPSVRLDSAASLVTIFKPSGDARTARTVTPHPVPGTNRAGTAEQAPTELEESCRASSLRSPRQPLHLLARVWWLVLESKLPTTRVHSHHATKSRLSMRGGRACQLSAVSPLW